MRILRYGVVALLAVGFGVVDSYAADTVRVCAYNVLRYTADNEDGRLPQYRAIMEQIRPDLLMCVEVADGTMGPRFVADVLTWGSYAATPYIDGPDMNAQAFYDQQHFSFVSQRRIPTALRDIAEFVFVTKPPSGLSADTIVLYALHLKASDSQSDAAQRASEVRAMMQSMSTARYVVVGGDLNIYAPTEAAYQQLVGATASPRRFVDPLGTVWQRNVSAFAGMYTQCTRSTNIAGCGGGVTGGIDDRFDYLFVSQELEPRTLMNTYMAFGNDGIARLNKAINNPPNQIVTSDVADALLCASDHLPVYVDVLLGDVPASVTQRTTTRLQMESDTAVLTGCKPGQMITVYDLVGREVYARVARDTSVRLDLSSLQKGLYLITHAGLSKRVVL